MNSEKLNNELQNSGKGQVDKESKRELPKIAAHMKYISLFCLVIQNAVWTLLMRKILTKSGERIFATTAVMASETIKLAACLLIILYQHKGNIKEWGKYLLENVILKPKDTLKVAIPGLLYMIQNNLGFLAIANLPAATYQVTYQLKILTTALFSVLLLGKPLSKLQWLSMVLLFTGVAIVQVQAQSKPEKKIADVEQNALIGLTAVLLSALSSGFAGVYFEKIVKRSKGSVWLRSFQLGLVGVISSAISVYTKDRGGVLEKGFFYGYSSLVWTTISMQAFGGLLVAMVVKYADNILKGFATSLSIMVSTFASVFLFHFDVTAMFVFGAALTMLAIYIYSLPAKEGNDASVEDQKKGL